MSSRLVSDGYSFFGHVKPACLGWLQTMLMPSIQKDSLRIALEGVLLISWRLPTLPRVCSTIGVTGLNFSVRNGKRWNPGAITTRMGDMMNATLYLQTTTSLKKCAEETKPRVLYDNLSLISLFAYRLCYKERSTTYGIYRDDSHFSSLVRLLYI